MGQRRLLVAAAALGPHVDGAKGGWLGGVMGSGPKRGSELQMHTL